MNRVIVGRPEHFHLNGRHSRLPEHLSECRGETATRLPYKLTSSISGHSHGTTTVMSSTPAVDKETSSHEERDARQDQAFRLLPQFSCLLGLELIPHRLSQETGEPFHVVD